MADQIHVRSELTQVAASGVELPSDAYQLPCSLVQWTCWFLDRMSPGSAAYNIAVRFLLQGPLDVALLEEALRTLMQRHEVLRTRFTEENGEPRQLIEPFVPFTLPLVDLRELVAEERSVKAEDLADQEAKTGFDILNGPLFRGRLIQTDDNQFMLLLTMHHIVSDGWSVGLITDEMGKIYEGLANSQVPVLPELPIQYGDYACWQQEWIGTGELDRQLEDLRCRLDGFEPLSIPTDFERPAAPAASSKICSLLLPRALTETLKKIGERNGCTMFVTMLSAFLVLLHLQSKQSELTIRTQTAGRDRVELESLIGWFVNSIVLRTDVSGNPRFEELVKKVQNVVIDGFKYQHVPFERLMEVIRPKQVPSRHPPFQANFIFQRDFVRPWTRAGVTMTPIPSKATGTFVDLNFFLVEREDGWRTSVDVSTDVFHPDSGIYFLDCYRQILAAVAKNPGVQISDLTLPARPFSRKLTPRSETYSLDNYVPPRNEHEEAVVEIWQKVLGVNSIGAYSNFFDLGGHSLKAVRLLAEFQRRFGLEIKTAELFIDPTPAAMAQIISGESIYSDDRDFIPIQPNGTRPPFFLVGGDHWFRPLSKYVGDDQPFLGLPMLKYRHMDIGRERLSIATELADILIRQYGGTPFYLGGWCADGLTAYEISRELSRRGQTVGLMVLIDAVNPDYYREARTLVHAAGKTMTSLGSVFRAANSRGLIKGLPSMTRSLAGMAKRLGQRMADTVRSGYSSQPATFPVLLLRPPSTTLEQPDLGWNRACLDKLTVVEVPGDHTSIFREPNVGVLGWRLRAQLDLALGRIPE